MKEFNRIILYLFFALLTCGCSEQISFKELTKDIPLINNVRIYSSEKLNYKVSIPKRFELIDKTYYDTLSIEVLADTTISYIDGTGIISILKYNHSYTESSIEEVWEHLLKNRKLIEDFRIYSEGLTDYLSEPSYYEHSSCTISNMNRESISFLFRGKSSSFYLISLQVNTEKDYPENMKELLYCAKSMKIQS